MTVLSVKPGWWRHNNASSGSDGIQLTMSRCSAQDIYSSTTCTVPLIRYVVARATDAQVHTVEVLTGADGFCGEFEHVYARRWTGR